MDRRRIDIDTVAAAERLAGVRYTDDERLQMLETLERQVRLTQKLRAWRPENVAPMALRFDPRLPGSALPAQSGSLRFSKNDPGSLPAEDTDIAFAPVTRLSGWLRAGVLTSQRLVEIYLSRIARLDDRLASFATVTAEIARAQAMQSDERRQKGEARGPLDGIPFGAKDILDTQAVETAWGAEPFCDRVPETDAVVVARLRAAGAVLLGKTAVGALAYEDIWYGGITRNPWNPAEGARGSSAGSAAATAAGLAGFCIGSETLGSIVLPSERCGATGLRPTFGRVPRTGCMTLAGSLDKIGPICRSVEDTALVLAVLNGPDRGDLSSVEVPFSFEAGADWRELRIGYLPEAFGAGAAPIDHATLAAVRDLGVLVNPVSLPDLPYDALVPILTAEAAAMFENLTLEDADDMLRWQDDVAWPNTFRSARFLSAVDHVQRDRLRFQAMLALDRLFRDIDVLVGPAQTGPMLVASNFTGHPCLHLRAGFQHLPSRAAEDPAGPGAADSLEEAGRRYRVPRGISLWGRLYEESSLLAFGMALEAALGVAAETPEFAR
jgi:Asp-tRNA(Asn)/Glu-tRNA(Gln) amidotransferase A subunit family amidase